ncbi:HlyD family efflux transporter periplasmic adaptor subunit [Thiomicrospira microaerophila]|uniref:HlyD family efflux transporter periplasmic adaptor subunit n=1 Tax=Thiomicrospira microaerophila TaxID=406020 RepID=UPI000697C102|nr:HlyD family efflux transporter periplasmic adaptor subunit [Thiomicrospira microaerophila]
MSKVYQSDRAEHQFSGSRRVIYMTFLVLASFVTWAYFAELEEVVRAPGKVVSDSRTQVVQSQDGGRLDALLVREGDVVEAGQLLARVDRVRLEASFLETRAKAAGLSATAARLEAEMLEKPVIFPRIVNEYPRLKESQLVLMRKRKQAISEDIHWLERVRSLAEEEWKMNLPLMEAGDVSRNEVLRLERQVAELSSQIVTKRNGYFQEVQAELSRTLEELESVNQLMVQRQSMLEQTDLFAPMRGVVKNLQITTMGGVIRAGDEVMHIVPLEETLFIEAKASPRDIAFLELGYPVAVKVDAYDYTIYGDLPGRLVFISADTVKENERSDEEAFYRIRVRTEGRVFSATPDRELDILPGMTATVEIKTGQRTVMQYLLKPIVKTLSESMGER